MDQSGLSLLHGLCLNAKSKKLGLCQAVIALGELRPKHPGVFLPDIIESILSERDPDVFLKACRIRCQIHK